MKPFLGVDLTTNSKNEQTIGNEFLIKKTPTELTQKIQMQANKMDTTMHKSHISSVLQSSCLSLQKHPFHIFLIPCVPFQPEYT